MDNDDIMCSEALQNAYNVIIKNDFPDLLNSNYRVVNSITKEVQNMVYSTGTDTLFNAIPTGESRVVWASCEQYLPSMLWCKFVKRKLYIDNNIRFEDRYFSAQDLDVSMKIWQYADRMVMGDFYSIDWYHPREGSVSTNFSVRSIEGRIYVFSDYIKKFEEWNLSETEKEKSVKFYLNILRGYITFLFDKDLKSSVRLTEYVEKTHGKRCFYGLSTKADWVTFVYKMYNIIGVKNSVILVNIRLRSYLKLKSILINNK